MSRGLLARAPSTTSSRRSCPRSCAPRSACSSSSRARQRSSGSRPSSSGQRRSAAPRALETRMQALLNRLDVGIYRATLDGDLLDANPACLRLLRLTTLDDDSSIRCARSAPASPLQVSSRQPGAAELDDSGLRPRDRIPGRHHVLDLAPEDRDRPRVRASVRRRDHGGHLPAEGERAAPQGREPRTPELERGPQPVRVRRDSRPEGAAPDGGDVHRAPPARLFREARSRCGRVHGVHHRGLPQGRTAPRRSSHLRARGERGGRDRASFIDAGSALDAAILNLHRAIEESGAEIVAQATFRRSRCTRRTSSRSSRT